MKRIRYVLLAVCTLLPVLAGCAGEPEMAKTTAQTLTAEPASQTGGSEETKPAAETAVPAETANAQTAEKKEYDMKEHRCDELADKIRLMGERTNIAPEGLITEWACSGFEMTLETNGTNVDLIVDTTYTNFFHVFVDGVNQEERAAAAPGTGKRVTAVKDLPAGTHLIRIVKDSQTEKKGGNCTVTAVLYDGEAVETDLAKKDLFLEFVGDSIWTGVGALGNRGSSPTYSSEICATAAVPYLTATELGADYNVTARGSIGIVRAAGKYTASQLFARQNAYRADEVAYTPSRAPAAVIICLSANDPADKAQQFIDDGKAFIAQIRSLYGEDVKIVWTYGMFNKTKFVKEIKQIVSECGGADNGVYALEMIYGQNGSGSGDTNRHPSVSDHRKNADLLIPYLKELLTLS